MANKQDSGATSLTYGAPVFCVSDIEGMMQYMAERLGFRVQGQAGTPVSWASLFRDTVEIMLVRGDCAAPPAGWGAYIYVKQVDALYAELQERGADVLGPPVDQPYNNREFEVRLPDGRLIAFGG